MNRSEVADLLSVVTAFDHRTIGEADVHAWHLILADYPLADCAQAVKEHYTQRSDWLMPAHIVERATVIDEKRRGRQRVAENAAAQEAEDRAIAAVPSEPVDREQLAQRLKALAAAGRGAVPRVDRRGDATRRAEARRELEAIRHTP